MFAQINKIEISSSKMVFAAAFATATLLSLVQPETADARPSTRSYTCEGVKDLIYDRGAVVMDHKKRGLYQRFVANHQFCARGLTTARFTVPTRTGRCRLYICRDRSYFRRRN